MSYTLLKKTYSESSFCFVFHNVFIASNRIPVLDESLVISKAHQLVWSWLEYVEPELKLGIWVTFWHNLSIHCLLNISIFYLLTTTPATAYQYRLLKLQIGYSCLSTVSTRTKLARPWSYWISREPMRSWKNYLFCLVCFQHSFLTWSH